MCSIKGETAAVAHQNDHSGRVAELTPLTDGQQDERTGGQGRTPGGLTNTGQISWTKDSLPVSICVFAPPRKPRGTYGKFQ